MGQKENRRLLRIGGAFALTLPPGWVRFNNLRPGDALEIVEDGDLHIKVPSNADSSPPAGPEEESNAVS